MAKIFKNWASFRGDPAPLGMLSVRGAKGKKPELPTKLTTREKKLKRAGWKLALYSDREDRNLSFPRGVWWSPKGEGPHSADVAFLVAFGKPANGKPFAECEDLAALARKDRQEASAARHAEREAIRAEARDRAEVRRREKSLA